MRLVASAVVAKVIAMVTGNHVYLLLLSEYRVAVLVQFLAEKYCF